MSVVSWRGARGWMVVAAVAALVAALVPAWLAPGDVTDVTLAVTRGALAAAASVALAVGRPSLGVAAVGGVAGYASGYAAMHGWAVPLAMLGGVGMAVAASVALCVVGARLSAAAFVALTLVATLAGGALVAALPDQLGGASGLQPVPILSVPLPGGDSLVFGPAGILHVTLLLVAAGVVVCGAVLLALPGARWRAIGGDRARSRDAGLQPLRGTLTALAVSGALAGLGGVLAVHATGVASPSAFSVDAAVLPLLAALLAVRGGPAAAALVGAAVGALGLRVLPALGWTGPPGPEALATGVLAALTLLVLPGAAGWRPSWRRRDARVVATAAEARQRDAGGAAAPPAGGDSGLDAARDARGPAARSRGGDGGLDTARGAGAVAAPWPGGDRGLDAAGVEVVWSSLHPPGGPVGLVVRGLDVVPEPGAAPLTRLDMSVPPGTVQGLVGPNGAGKSTALRQVAEALLGRSRGGAVRLEPAVTGARTAVLPQQGGGWPGTTVAETLRLAARAGGRSRRNAREAAAEWSELLGLENVEVALCDSLSHGVRRRVELARVLLLRPSVLLCDEPLAGLDGADRELALQGLRAAAAAGVTLVVAEHDRASLARIATATTELHRLDLGGATDPASGAAPA